MQKQTIKFAVETTNTGQIKSIGKSVIKHPKVNFSGGSVKWYDDKSKSHKKDENKFMEVSENV